MADSEAMIGYGSIFEIANSGDSPTSFISLGEINSITPPSAQVDQVDVTHMQSAGRRREFIDGLIDSGECSFEMNYIPGSAGDTELNEILDLGVGVDRRRMCRITYPNSVTHTFLGSLQTYEPSVPLDDKMMATVTLKVSGVVTRGVAA
jgi:predicted secreted protein